MADDLEKGKNYLKYIYEKIMIAVAVAVIRSRPANLSLEEYIESLKITSKIRDVDGYNGAISMDEDAFLDVSQQQELLFNKLWAVFPNTTEISSEDKPVADDDEDIDVSQDLFASELNESNYNCDLDGAEEADTNMRFIQAIVQLNSVINKRSSVPAHQFHDVLQLFLTPEEMGQNSYKKRKSDESISCCALRYVMRSSETNKLLYLAVQQVLSYLGQSIKSSWWDGDDETSLISHSINTVKQVIEFVSTKNDSMGICLGACLKFVTDLINDMKNGKELNKGEIWERHCAVIIEFCKSRYLCVNTISYLVENLINISKELERSLAQDESSGNDCSCGPQFDPVLIENSWYLLYVTKGLLMYNNKQEWNNDCIPSYTECRDTEASDIRRIRDLWRLSWKGSETQHVADGTLYNFPSLDSSITVKWKEELSHYVKVLSQHYPLFTYELYECEKLIV